MKQWFGWLVIAIVSWGLVLAIKTFVPFLFVVAFLAALAIAIFYRDAMPIVAVTALSLGYLGHWGAKHGTRKR